MGSLRLIQIVLALLVLSAEGAGAQTAGQSTGRVSDEPAGTAELNKVILPCSPVAAYWDGPPPVPGMPPGPQLAVVSIDVRPKDARVHLDDRFVGRARYLDGKPGYLYLEPGTYNLELRIEGYRTVLVEFDATPSCRYDLKHRMEKSRQKVSDPSAITYGKGEPFNRVFAPRVQTKSEVMSTDRPGPDPGLRRDLDSRSNRTFDAVEIPGASLRLRVSPDFASVSIDGAFVATGRELALMEGPLAVTAGKHDIFVSATGFIADSKLIELDKDVVLELEISLSEKRPD